MCGEANLTRDQDSSKLVEQEPFSPPEVKERANRALTSGTISPSPHAVTQMRKRALEITDVVNVLRGGQPANNPEGKEGTTWRYSMSTKKLKVVFCFDSDRLII